MRRVYFGLVIVGIVLGAVLPVSAQGGDRAPITPENADQLALVASLWRGTPTDAAWSADGTLIAIATERGVWLHDAADLTAEPRLLAVENDWLQDVAISPDGALIAAAGSDRTVYVWDFASGELISRLLDGVPGVRSVAWLPVEGAAPRLVVHMAHFTPRGGQIQVWGIDQLAPDVRLTAEIADSAFIYSVAVSPDGTMIAAGGSGGVQVWDRGADDTWIAREPVALGVITAVTDVAFSADGSRLAVTATDYGLHVFDSATLTEQQTLLSGDTPVRALVFGPAGDTLVVMGSTLTLWNAATGDLALEVPLNSSIAAFSPDESRLVTNTGRGSTVIMGSRKGEILAELQGYSAPLGGIAFVGDQIVALNEAERVMRWARDAAQPDEVINQGLDPVTCSAFSADGSRLAVAEQFGTVKLIDAATGRIVSTWDTGPIYGLAISADGGLVAWSDPDGALHVWDGATGEELAAMLNDTEMLTHHLAFNPTGTLLASTSYEDETLRLWDVTTGREIGYAFVNGGVDAVAFSPDGTLLAASMGSGGVLVWPVRDFRDWVAVENAIRYFLTQGGASVLVYSPDGALLAAAEGPNVHIFDAAVAYDGTVGTQLAMLNAGDVTGLTWSQDGSLLAAAGPGGVIRVWGVQ